MQIRHETYDTKGNLLKTEFIDVPDPEPSDIQIRFTALESKVGIQPKDLADAKAVLIAEPLQAIAE